MKVNFELNNWFYKSQPFVVAIFFCVSKTWMNKKDSSNLKRGAKNAAS
ncbi:hypothetical protein N577_002030 [Lacticaseibacillus rhamnosus 2166]|nr:hypothetical protein N577_002030 [Lacticaseibacillus rhamnosus 2166]